MKKKSEKKPAGKKPGVKKAPDKQAKTEQPEANIGMVGHVDHGKTSLTEALTGTWTDTHSEELKRGISIRLGYADVTFYKCSKCKSGQEFTNKPVCPTCGKKAQKLRKVSFVDSPGHETLMTTMLSGAALMHGAVLVIAANEECPQPQTEEHLMALKMAGIENIVVAQNKIDLVQQKQALENRKQIASFLEKHGFKNVPIVPIAANFSGNVDLLIEAIEGNIPTPKLELGKPLLMYCARSFDINKPGTSVADLRGGIVGGTIIQGKASLGKQISIRPGANGKELQTDIRSLSCSSGGLKEARAGGLIAIGTGLDPSLTQNDRMRGQVVGFAEDMPQPVNQLNLEVNFIKRLVSEVETKLSVNETIVLTIGTMSVMGSVVSVTGSKVKAGLASEAVVLPNQKIAISKKSGGRWQLVGYAITN